MMTLVIRVSRGLGCTVGRQWDCDSHRCARAARLQLKVSSQFPCPLMHTHQPDTRSRARLTKAIEHFFVYPAAIVSYFQSYLAGRSPDQDVCLRSAGMSMNVGQSFLQHSEKREFGGIGQAYRIIWSIQIQLESAAETKSLNIPPCRRGYSHSIHGGGMQQIG
jgi:hypothetical protein